MWQKKILKKMWRMPSNQNVKINGSNNKKIINKYKKKNEK